MPQLRDDYNIFCRTWLTADKSPCRRRIFYCNDNSCARTKYSIFWISSQWRRSVYSSTAGSAEITGLFHELYHFRNFLDRPFPSVYFYWWKRPTFKLDLYFFPDVCCTDTLYYCLFNWIHHIQTSDRSLLAKYFDPWNFHIYPLAIRM